jgi:hypothetical protein
MVWRSVLFSLAWVALASCSSSDTGVVDDDDYTFAPGPQQHGPGQDPPTDDTGDPAPPDLDGIEVDGVAPDFGTTRGGQEVTLTGGPFDASVRVSFGAAYAQVRAVTATEVQVTVPAAAEAGPVEVSVTTDTGAGSASSAFTYWEDGSGQFGAYGEIALYHYLGDYWALGDPADAAEVGVYVSEPNAAPYWLLTFAPELEKCVSDYDSGIATAFVDIGASGLELIGPSGETVALEPDPSQSWYYGAPDVAASDYVSSSAYDLGTVSSGQFPAIAVAGLAETPSTFELTRPSLDGDELAHVDREDFDIAWTGGASGDFMAARLLRTNGSGDTVETVTCAMNDDGAFTVPASVWQDWDAGSVLYVLLGRGVGSSGTLPHNDTTSGVAGMYWVVGAALTE